MSPALPVVSGQEVIKALARKRFRMVGQKGSHVKLRNPKGRTVIVPMREAYIRRGISGQ